MTRGREIVTIIGGDGGDYLEKRGFETGKSGWGLIFLWREIFWGRIFWMRLDMALDRR